MKTNQDDIFTKFFSCKNLEIGLFMMPNFFFFFQFIINVYIYNSLFIFVLLKFIFICLFLTFFF